MRQKPLLSLGIGVACLLIFTADTATDLEIALAVLYVAVVLTSMRFGQPRIVTAVGVICIVLTVISFMLTPHGDPESGLVNCGLSLLAIAGTTYLAAAIQRLDARARQAHADLAHMSRVMTVGELTSSIAHEVSQPLAAIVANAAAAKRWLSASTPDYGEAQRALSHIALDGDRAGQIIARARRLVARIAPSSDRIDLVEVIQETLALVQGEVDVSHVVLSMELADDLPSFSGDRIQLQQVILNYVVNALEALRAADRNPRELLVSAATYGETITVSVRDTGIGTTPQALDKVFDAFYTTKSRGIGMGLAISRSIVEAHGGSVYAAHNLPRGMVFGFTLPIRTKD